MTRKHATPSLFASREPPEPAGTHIIRVALASAADTEFDYLVPDALWPIEVGRRVEVPFGRGNKPEVGFCVESDVASERAFDGGSRQVRLKRVARVLDEEPLLAPI
jgi:primosomal protein N'